MARLAPGPADSTYVYLDIHLCRAPGYLYRETSKQVRGRDSGCAPTRHTRQENVMSEKITPVPPQSGAGCCGPAPDSTAPLEAATSPASPCCGTSHAAAGAGACCGPSAKQEAIAAGATCC